MVWRKVMTGMSEKAPQDPLDRFLDLSAAALSVLESPLARNVATAIRELPAALGQWENRHLPAADHFTAVCAMASEATRPLVDAVAALEDRFQWRGGGDHGFGDRKRGDLAYVPFVGLTSLVVTDAITCGIFLLAPGAFYPNHSHAADEIYYVIAGQGEWQKDSGDFVAYGPGSLIEMPSFTPHALSTGVTPVLILYAWIGDIGGEYRIL